MALGSLPGELLRLIVHYLDQPPDINAFTQTNRWIYSNVNAYLYHYDITHRNRSAIFWAARHGRDTTLEKSLSLKPYTDVQNKDGFTPLLLAIGFKRVSIFNRFLTLDGVDLERRDHVGRTALSTAANLGREEMVQSLLSHGADPETRDEDRVTPLILAAARGREGTVKILLAAGAVTESKDRRGRTPLSWASEYGHIGIMGCLLDNGADVESQDDQGRTPLSWAATNRYSDSVEVLVDAGADLNSVSENGWTPIFWAALRAREAVVRVLLREGVDPSLKDRRDMTPGDLVRGAVDDKERAAAVLKLLERKEGKGLMRAVVGRFLSVA